MKTLEEALPSNQTPLSRMASTKSLTVASHQCITGFSRLTG